ncbi:MAG TPA: hypothetical protein VH438_16845 [Gemmatimonadales bacterium]
MKAINPIPGRRSRDESRSEAREAGRRQEQVAVNHRATLRDIKDRLNQMIHVALGSRAAGYRKAHQLHRCY